MCKSFKKWILTDSAQYHSAGRLTQRSMILRGGFEVFNQNLNYFNPLVSGSGFNDEKT